MNITESLPALFFEFHCLCHCSAPFASLVLSRLRATNIPAEDLTIGQVRNIVLVAQGDYTAATEAENTDWPTICKDAAQALELAA